MFETVRCRDSDDFNFQRNSNLFRSPLQLFRYNNNPVSYSRVMFFACFLSKRVRNLSGWQKSACKLLNNLPIKFFCFIASTTATISSEVPSLGKGRHHILLFGELSSQISSFDMIFESTPHFLIAIYGCFNFGSSSLHFFEINGV